MSGSYFILLGEEAIVLLMKAFFPQLHYYETRVVPTWTKAAEEEYGFHILDNVIWLGIEEFIFQENSDPENAKLAERSLPYLGVKKNYIGAAPLHQLMKERIKEIFLEDFGADIDPDTLPEEYARFEPLRNYQRCYFRLLLLEELHHIHLMLGRSFPEKFQLAYERAQREEAAARQEIQFPMRALVSRRKAAAEGAE